MAEHQLPKLTVRVRFPSPAPLFGAFELALRAVNHSDMTFGADIGATVIGEGVEDADDLDALRDIGVPWAQGYHLGRPDPLPR